MPGSPRPTDQPSQRAGQPHVLDEMCEPDLGRVVEIENASHTKPWSRASFLREIRDNESALNLVLRNASTRAVDAYACAWLIGPEAQINNVAVHPSARGLGLAKRLLGEILDEAARKGCESAMLQVRPTNEPAIALYGRLGFLPVGRRLRYYSDNGEDALVMSRPLDGKGLG